MDILLTNPTITAARALEIGLVTEVVPDDQLLDRAHQLAGALAASAPLALAATKRLVWAGVGQPVESRLPEEARVVSELSGTADSREGLAAVIERRPPVFTGR
jgi:2-(1,2-epoxy-1,2-dihydrophenyl)acetyl-CoA isomerase